MKIIVIDEFVSISVVGYVKKNITKRVVYDNVKVRITFVFCVVSSVADSDVCRLVMRNLDRA